MKFVSVYKLHDLTYIHVHSKEMVIITRGLISQDIIFNGWRYQVVFD